MGAEFLIESFDLINVFEMFFFVGMGKIQPEDIDTFLDHSCHDVFIRGSRA